MFKVFSFQEKTLKDKARMTKKSDMDLISAYNTGICLAL